MAAARLDTILSAVPEAPKGLSKVCAARGENADDVVIVSGCRSALCKAKRGAFKDTAPSDLLAATIKEAVARAGIKPEQVDDLVLGNVNLGGAGAVQARLASLLAGLPNTTSCMSLNRQCSSGLQAVATVASAIKSGYYKIGVASGVENMSLKAPTPTLASLSKRLQEQQEAKDCVMINMGQTSENVAKQFGIGRERQDAFALESYNKALAAQKAGRFEKEIVPIKTSVKDKEGKLVEVVAKVDEGPRPTTLEKLAKLKPAFAADGCSHAGNSSQVTDGAASVVMMRRDTAQELGCPILGVFRGFATKGCPPRIMGIGPAVAIPEVLKQTGYAKDDIDTFELNEAFASQALYCMDILGLDAKKVNPNGGAIALGHPLGATGARCVVTLLHHLQAEKKDTGVVSMCIGTGMGAAAVFTRN